MLLFVSVAQQIFSLLFSTAVLVLLAILLQRRHLKSVYNDSPPLFLLFTSAALNSLSFFFFSAQWILLLTGRIRNVAQSNVFLLLPGILSHSVSALYDTAMTGIFIQRIVVLRFPLKTTAKINRNIVSVALLIAAASSSLLFYFNLRSARWEERPLSEGCMSFNCLNSLGKQGKTANVIIRVVLSIIILLTGAVFVVSLRKTQTKLREAAGLKINVGVKYMFIFRAFISITTGTCELTARAMSANLGEFIGPYATLLATLEIFLSMLVYFSLFLRREKKVFVPAERSRSVGLK